MKSEDIILAVAIALLAVLPVTGDEYLLYLSAKILILILYATAFNIIFGYTGLLSFGHALFFSSSAYVLAILTVRLYNPLILGLFAGVIVAAAFSAGIGFLSLRHREIHFALVTLAFSMMFWGVVMKWRDLTGGEDGIAGVPRIAPLFWFYYLTLIVVIACIYIIYRFVKSDFGLVLKGMRENETRVRYSGHSPLKFRLYAMTISGTFTGIAGLLWAMLERTVTPSISHWSFSAIPVIASLIGGPQSFLGPAVGTVIYIIAQDIITKYTLYWQFLLGIVVVAVVLFFRGGVMGIVEELVGRR